MFQTFLFYPQVLGSSCVIILWLFNLQDFSMTKVNTIKNVTETKDVFSPYNFEGSLRDLAQKIDALIAQYGESAYLDYDPNYYYPYDQVPSPSYFVKLERPETPEETQARLEQEAQWQRQREEQERKEFERLKEKFKSS